MLDKKKEGFICGAQEIVLNTRYRVGCYSRESIGGDMIELGCMCIGNYVVSMV